VPTRALKRANSQHIVKGDRVAKALP